MQQDDPHYARNVRNTLNQTFSNRWIGRDGPVNWFPRSLDLTLNFFLWGYLKSIVYQKQPTTPDDIRTQIRMACTSIPVMTLMQAERAFTEQLRLCMHMRGCQFEHYR